MVRADTTIENVAVAERPLAIFACTEFAENFDVAPPASWTVINRSNPVGTTTWFQATGTPFPAHSGVASSFVAANFNSRVAPGPLATGSFCRNSQ